MLIGRDGSKGLPGKNSLTLAGQPMICHSIQDAIEARCVERIMVSTDGRSIAQAAREMGVEVVDRPAELATDTASVQDVVRHAIASSGAAHNVVIILYANVPVRPDDLIDRAFDRLMSSGADSVQSYCDVGKHHPHWMVSLDDERRVQSYVPQPAGTSIDRRQDLPKLLIPDGGVIAVRQSSVMREKMASPHDFLGEDRRGIETLPGEVVDVDCALDLALAETILTGKTARSVSGVLRA